MNLLSLSRKLYQYLKRQRDLRLLRASGLFDRDWYLTHNPDVAQAGVDPVLHYLHYGGFEGRNPGPQFDSRWYLDCYEDVRKAAINPLIHYLQYGRQEGRKARPGQTERMEFADSRSLSDVITAKENSSLPVYSGRPKVFCIGLNKTGTTSLERALMDLGYKMGVQVDAASLMDDWAVRDFRRIVEFCKTAEAFQDVPFSLDFTYQILDHAFPGSKFILTVRNSAEEWYRSLVRFHAQIMGVKGIPTANDVKNFHLPPHDKDFFWRQQQHIFGVTESTLYDQDLYQAYYINHNCRALEYFKLRPNDLLPLNLSDPNSMQSLCNFLGVEYTNQVMPYLNKSSD